MFHIKGIVGLKFLSNGGIYRLESEVKYHLNTDLGVVRFIEEFNPFASISIKENQSDVTDRFKKYIIFAKPRATIK